MEILGVTLIVAILATFAIASRSKTNNKQLERIESELLASIEEKTEELEELEQIIEHRESRDAVQLHPNALKVLAIYEQSNIRIQLDILEELSYNVQLKTPYDIFSFIEQQRQSWKLENSKKPYRKVTK